MQYLTVEDVAKILKIGKNQTYALFKQEGFPAVKVGRAYRVNEEDFKKFMKDNIGRKVAVD